MELNSAHQRTDIGAIPADWSISQLGEGIKLKSGHHVLAQHCNTNGEGVPYLTGPADFLAGAIQHTKYTVRPGTICAAGDILVTVKGSGAGTLVRSNGSYCISRQLMAISVMHWSSAYIYFSLLRDASRFGAAAAGLIPGISRTDLLNWIITIPPTRAEQKSIANALSDADALIESLEQLLAKKRNIKEGAMQELLTGQRRLPGFAGKVEVRALGDLGDWVGGMTPSMSDSRYWDGGTVPWISSGDVKSSRLTSTAFSVSIESIKEGVTKLVPENSIIVVTRSGILRKHLPVAINLVSMAINQDVKALLPRVGVVPEYLLQALDFFGARILATCLKSGTTVESIEFPWLKAFVIPMPSPEEQIAIAAVLGDIDAETDALEAKLAKARQLKQGMMQELLTGRIRLVNHKAA
jgi:type I restriction enzyme S subunit